MATEPVRSEANRLYWETDAPVSVIADQLGLSRRALYELLEPMALPEPCPSCGGRLIFENRLARSAAEVVCEACGAHWPTTAMVAAGVSGALDDVPGSLEDGPAAAVPDPPDGEQAAWDGADETVGWTRTQALEPRVHGSDYLVAVAAGLAVGLLTAFLLTRRRD